MQIGSIIEGKYEVMAKIGQGGMGTVLRVRRIKDGKTLALKYCHLTDKIAKRRFAREARAMQRIKHDNIVPLIDVCEDGTPPYFVMPLADSTCAGTIREFAGEEAKAINAFLEICEGVRALHAAGMVHRDIKPDNALIYNDRIVVSDFGLICEAHRETTILTQTQMIVGTEAYLAPEQRLPGGSRDADFRTDVYQLGKNLYQFVTGRLPAMIDPTGLAAGLAYIVRKATAEHPNERFQSVGELVDAVNAYMKSRNPALDPKSAFENILGRIKERSRRHEYKRTEIIEMLDVLASELLLSEPDGWLEMFDQIPVELLQILPQASATKCEFTLSAYIVCLEKRVETRTFSYAETVASKCEAIFSDATGYPKIRASCIEALLIAATTLNRFAAISILESMLISIKEDDEVWAVREAVSRHRAAYNRIVKGIPATSLNAALRFEESHNEV